VSTEVPVSTAGTLSDPVLERPRIVRWFAARPRIFDVLIILVCTAPPVAALLLEPHAHAWLGHLCAAGVAVVFWWRRSHPLAALLLAVGFAALNPLAAMGTTAATMESAFGVYTLASLTRLRTAFLGYLAAQAVILASSGLAVLLGTREQPAAVGIDPIALAALATGVAVRASRGRRAAIRNLITMREERAAAAERARITAEMHDVVAHSVTMMIALAGGARAGWEKHPARAREALEQLGTVGAQALEEMQRILRLLREHDDALGADLQHSGHSLPPLEELIAVFRAAGLPVVLDAATQPSEPALRTTVYRLVQEALTNALRYAREATHVEVAVHECDDRLAVTVTDNGRPGTAVESLGAGLGLRAMRERTAAFHGTFEAGPVPTAADAPGTGWRVRAVLPLKGPEQA
jgi:signal transduction histidine kinase